MIGSKYQHATPEIPVFFILLCLKMHNCVNELISCNSKHLHKLNTQLSTKTNKSENELRIFKTTLRVTHWYLVVSFFKTFK